MSTMSIRPWLAALRKFVAAHQTQTAAAKALAISPAYLSDILAGKRGLSEPVAKRLGFERRTVYTPTEER